MVLETRNVRDLQTRVRGKQKEKKCLVEMGYEGIISKVKLVFLIFN